MKIRILLTISMLLGVFVIANYGQNNNGCNGGKRNGIIYTDCWQDTGDDTVRLNAALSLAVGKVVFNESYYTITDSLTVYSYRIIEGLTRNSYGLAYGGSNINFDCSKSSAPDKVIFKIGESIHDVSIRDLALVGGQGCTEAADGVVGIKANGTDGASTGFQFSNLVFRI